MTVGQQAQALRSPEEELQRLRTELADRDGVQAQDLKERDEALVSMTLQLLKTRRRSW